MTEESFVNNFTMQIILQLLLLISSKPDSITYLKETENELKNKKFFSEKNKERKLNKFLFPRVLDLSYVEKTVRADDRQGKKGMGCSQSPKRPHWRLGYEVNKPIGKMKGVPKEQWERKLIKVAPYFVMGNAGVDDEEE